MRLRGKDSSKRQVDKTIEAPKPPSKEKVEQMVSEIFENIPTSEEDRDLIIISMPGTSQRQLQNVGVLMSRLTDYINYPVVLTHKRLEPVTKNDILELKNKLDHICKENGWKT